METKQELVQSIKDWIAINKDIDELKKTIKIKNQQKKSITENLVGTMKENEIDCFEITGGALVYKKCAVKKPISGKSLLTLLKKYYPADKPQLAEEITKYILDNREVKVNELIRHKIDK
jgi:hypothetical protein